MAKVKASKAAPVRCPDVSLSGEVKRKEAGPLDWSSQLACVVAAFVFAGACVGRVWWTALLALMAREAVHAWWNSSPLVAGFSPRSRVCVFATFMLGLAAGIAGELIAAIAAVVVLGRAAGLACTFRSTQSVGTSLKLAISWVICFLADPITDIVAYSKQLWRLAMSEKQSPWPIAARMYWAVFYLHFLVYVLVAVLVRTVIAYVIVGGAVTVRCICRLFDPTAFETPKGAKRRVLFVTDYMPPQVHGIAVRCHNYVEHLRKGGDDVVVFTTQADDSMPDCHSRLPHITNPFNEGNRISFAPGVVLSWHLAMYDWDMVHIVYPSLLGMFILPLCQLRGIPSYCSHHVDMAFYGPKYVGRVASFFGNGAYNFFTLLPAQLMATANAAPTHVFLDNHMDKSSGARYRVPSGVEACMRLPRDEEERVAEREALLQRCGVPNGKRVKLFFMCQRIAPEKNTKLALEALAMLHSQGEPVHMAVAGNGPSLEELKQFAAKKCLPVTFLGNVHHRSLPALYRAADAFVTCSLSETFGLTLAETLSCGTPAAMPHHIVFDELWADRVPAEWRFDASEGPRAVANSMMAACDGRQQLLERPVNLTWADAAVELSNQYQEIIDSEQARDRRGRRFWRSISNWVNVTTTTQ